MNEEQFENEVAAYFTHRLGLPVGEVVLDHQAYSEVTLDTFINGITIYAPSGSLLREYTLETDREATTGNEQRAHVIADMFSWISEKYGEDSVRYR